MNFGLDFIKKLKPKKFNWRPPNSDGLDHFGFIAQEVDTIASRLKYGFIGIKYDNLTINYEEFIGPIVKAIQELSAKIDKLEANKRKSRKA